MADSFPVWHRLLHDLNIEYEMPQVPLAEITWRNGHCRALRQIKVALSSRAWRKGTPTSRIAAALALQPGRQRRGWDVRLAGDRQTSGRRFGAGDQIKTTCVNARGAFCRLDLHREAHGQTAIPRPAFALPSLGSHDRDRKGASAAILVDTLPRWRRSADEALARTTMWLTSLCRCS